MLIQEPAHTIFLLDKAPVPGGDPTRKPLGIGQANRTSLQWIVHQAVAGAAATIALFLANTDREPDLTDLDPTTNPYWSPLEDMTGTPITFPHQPGAVLASCLMPVVLLSQSTLLAVVTITGNPYPSGAFSLLARTTG